MRRPFKIVMVPLAEPGSAGNLGSAYVAANTVETLGRAGLRTDLSMRDDLDRTVHTPEQLAAKILAERPDLVGFGLYAWNAHVARRVAALLREAGSHATIVAGGPWLSREAERFARANPAFDLVVRGSGEVAFAAIAARRASGDRAASWDRIPGTLFLADGEVRATPPVPVDPNTLPSPYRTGLVKLDVHMLLALRRGCPKHCTYCTWGDTTSVAMTSATLEAELTWGAAHGVKSLYLADAALNWQLEDLRTVDRAARRFGERAGHRLNLTATLDHDRLDAARLALIRSSGYDSVGLGLQTTNPVALRLIRRKADLDGFARAVEALSPDREVVASLILGLPGDDPEGFRRTVDYAAALGVSVGAYLLMGLPGTEMETRREEFGLEFNRDGMPYLLRSSTFSHEDLRAAAAYFVTHCGCKTRFSDFTTRSALFSRYPYNYWVPEGVYREAHEKFREPLPPPEAVPGAKLPAASGTIAVGSGGGPTSSPGDAGEPPRFPSPRCVTCAGLDACAGLGRTRDEYPSCRTPNASVDPRVLRRLFAWWKRYHGFTDRRLGQVARLVAARAARDEGRFSEVFEPSYSRDEGGEHYFRFSYGFPGFRDAADGALRDIAALSRPFGAEVARWVASLAEHATQPCVSHPLFGLAYDGPASWRVKAYLQFKDDAREQAALLTEKIAGRAALQVLSGGELHMLGVDLGTRGISGVKLYLRYPSVPLARPGRALRRFACLADLRSAGVAQLDDVLAIHRMRRPDDPDFGTPSEIDFPVVENDLLWDELASRPPLACLAPAARGLARLATAARTAVRRVSLSRSGDKVNLYYVPTGPGTS